MTATTPAIWPDAREIGEGPPPAEHEAVYRFEVTGTLRTHGTMVHPYAETFDIIGEGMGAALDCLVSRSGMWDGLDTDKPVTIEISERDS